jgi:hypothetical protein
LTADYDEVELQTKWIGFGETIQTKSWDKRVNLMIFGMIVVDSYLFHQEWQVNQSVF